MLDLVRELGEFGIDSSMTSTRTSRHIHAIPDPSLLLVFSSFTAYAQSPADTERLWAKGDSLRTAGNLPAAAQTLHEAFEATLEAERGGDDGIGYALASTLGLMGGQNDNAFMILSGILPSLTSMKVLHDPDMYFLVEDERWGAVETAMLDNLKEEVGSSFNREKAAELLAMRRSEWVGRYHIMLLFRQTGGQSPALSLISHAMGERHKQNEADLIAMLQESGWPQVSEVGEEAAYAATNVLTHMGLEARQIYLPLLAVACEAGEADWSEYAPSLDRTELELGRPQIYGTQMELDDELERYVPRELVDPDKVDERRASIGMEPIVDQLARFNAAMARDFGEGE